MKRKEALAHHGFIKLLACDALERQVFKIPWEEFISVDKQKSPSFPTTCLRTKSRKRHKKEKKGEEARDLQKEASSEKDKGGGYRQRYSWYLNQIGDTKKKPSKN